MMKKYAGTLAALTLLITMTGCEQLSGSFGPQVAVIDLQAVARATGQYDAISAQIGEANELLESQLQELLATMEQQLSTEKTRLGGAPAEGEQEKLDTLTAKAQQQLQQSRLLAQQKSQQYQAQLLNEFREAVLGVARPIANRRNASVILTASATLLWFDASIDITDEVIAEMRAESNENKSTVAPAPIERDRETAATPGKVPDTAR